MDTEAGRQARENERYTEISKAYTSETSTDKEGDDSREDYGDGDDEAESSDGERGEHEQSEVDEVFHQPAAPRQSFKEDPL